MKQAATSDYADDEKDYDGTKPLYHWAYICQSGSRHVLILRARSIPIFSILTHFLRDSHLVNQRFFAKKLNDSKW